MGKTVKVILYAYTDALPFFTLWILKKSTVL